MPTERAIPYGYCQCGCGGQTELAKWSYLPDGPAAGEPHAFIRGHHPAHHYGNVRQEAFVCIRCQELRPRDEFGGPQRSGRRSRRTCDSCLRTTRSEPTLFLNSIDNHFASWLSGFIDGEGSFTITRNTSRKSFRCRLRISLRDDDAEVLLLIYETLGIGNIYQVKPHADKGTRTQVGWVVEKLPDCLALVSLIDRHPLLAKKRRDFAIWREAVLLWATLLPRDDWSGLAALASQLVEERSYNGRA